MVIDTFKSLNTILTRMIILSQNDHSLNFPLEDAVSNSQRDPESERSLAYDILCIATWQSQGEIVYLDKQGSLRR